jgi:hypothetical protein
MEGDFFNSIPALVCGSVFLILLVASLIWVYRDAENRGKSGCLRILIIWVTWPLGLIAYLLLRDREVRL